MSDPATSFDEATMCGELKERACRTVEGAVNVLLEKTDDLVGCGRCEHGLAAVSGWAFLKTSKLKKNNCSCPRKISFVVPRVPQKFFNKSLRCR